MKATSVQTAPASAKVSMTDCARVGSKHEADKSIARKATPQECLKLVQHIREKYSRT